MASKDPPVIQWGLDPLFNCCPPFFASAVLTMQPAQDVPGSMLLCGRPVNQVELMGFVVDVGTSKHFHRFVVDDGSACLPCIIWKQEWSISQQLLCKEATKILQVGCLVRIQGVPSIFRNQHQLTVDSIQLEIDSNFEHLHWINCLRLLKTLRPVHPTLH